MSDWINLDIGNIPSDFFVNERYEIQHSAIYGTHSDSWGNATNEPSDRHMYIKVMAEGQVKYRYRLKPLEPIRISKEESRQILQWIWDTHEDINFDCRNDILTMWNNREVEIID